MAKMSAADRYAARKTRVAIDLRHRTIEAADRAVRHARLQDRYGDDWREMLARALNRNQVEWERIAELNLYRRPANPGHGRGVV